MSTAPCPAPSPYQQPEKRNDSGTNAETWSCLPRGGTDAPRASSPCPSSAGLQPRQRPDRHLYLKAQWPHLSPGGAAVSPIALGARLVLPAFGLHSADRATRMFGSRVAQATGSRSQEPAGPDAGGLIRFFFFLFWLSRNAPRLDFP